MPGDIRNIKMGSVWVAVLRKKGEFRWLGYSEGGPTLNYAATSTDIFVDQRSLSVLSHITDEAATFAFPSVEVTKDNLMLAFPGTSIRGNVIDIYPASKVSTLSQTCLILLHPVWMGEPEGDVVNFDDPNYDSSRDMMFFGTPAATVDLTFTRQDIMHIGLNFKIIPDNLGRLLVWEDPMADDLNVASLYETMTGTTLDLSTIATGAGTSFKISAFEGWDLVGTNLNYTGPALVAGEKAQNLVFAQLGDAISPFFVVKAG